MKSTRYGARSTVRKRRAAGPVRLWLRRLWFRLSAPTARVLSTATAFA